MFLNLSTMTKMLMEACQCSPTKSDEINLIILKGIDLIRSPNEDQLVFHSTTI